MKDLFSSRKFWVALLTLIVLIVSQVSPAFHLEVEEAAGLVVVMALYVVGAAVDPGPGGWRGVVQSRKFWTAAATFVLMVLKGFAVVVPPEISTEIVVLLCITAGGYISGVALEKPKRDLLREALDRDWERKLKAAHEYESRQSRAGE
jgi:uncharacterized membrane protein